MPDSSDDERYLELLLNPLDICARYTPKFGTNEKGVSLEQFKMLYGADPFYHWIGLDSDLMYAAHKAAGGMTSIYRQLGVGCELLFRKIIQDKFDLTDEEVAWSYEITKDDKKKAKLTLDGRIDVGQLSRTRDHRVKVLSWLQRCGDFLKIPDARIKQLRLTFSAAPHPSASSTRRGKMLYSGGWRS